MNLSGIGTEGVALLSLYILIKDGLVPLIKRLNGKNKTSLEKFYQEWNDFKLETFQNYKNEVKERCDKREVWLKEIDDKVDEIRINMGRKKK